MESELDESVAKPLTVYKLPDDKVAHQPYIDRAEEDLLCAVSLYRQGACGYLPLNNVCYLLHQTIEKWLKLLIEVQGLKLSFQGQHELYGRFKALGSCVPELLSIRDAIEAVDGKLMGHKFPGELRYNEISPDIDRYVEALLKAAFATRRLVKRYLKLTEEAP